MKTKIAQALQEFSQPSASATLLPCQVKPLGIVIYRKEGSSSSAELVVDRRGEVCVLRARRQERPSFIATEVLLHQKIAQASPPPIGLQRAYSIEATPEGTYFLEPILSCDLLCLIDAKCIFEDDQRISMLLQVIEGLAYLHRLGFIHRDVKPDNILVGLESGRLKAVLTDYAFASTFETTTDQGSVKYCPPELWTWIAEDVNKPRTFSPAFDVWSLGIVVYMIVIYRFPSFLPKEKIGPAAMHQLLMKEVKEVSDTDFKAKRCASMPPFWASIFMECCRYTADERITLSALKDRLFTPPPPP